MDSVKKSILNDVWRTIVLRWHVKYWNLVDKNYIIFVKGAVWKQPADKNESYQKEQFWWRWKAAKVLKNSN